MNTYHEVYLKKLDNSSITLRYDFTMVEERPIECRVESLFGDLERRNQHENLNPMVAYTHVKKLFGLGKVKKL